VANIVAVLFGMHYRAYFYAGKELVLPKHTSFLVITRGDNTDGSGYVVAVFILRTFLNLLQEEGV
jgi:hypothetical protein